LLKITTKCIVKLCQTLSREGKKK